MEVSGSSVDVMDLRELGRFVVRGVMAGDFIIAHGLEEAAALLHRAPTPSPRASCRRPP